MIAPSFLRKYKLLVGVFYKQDSQILLSLLPRYLWAIFICMIYRFVFQAALSGRAVHVGQYALPFPVFLISGIASMRLLLFALKVFEETVSDIRKAIPLGEVLITPTSLWEIMLAHVMWKGFLAINELLAVLVSAKILLNISLTPFFLPPVIVSAALIMLSHAGMGMTVSAANLFVKKADAVFILLQQISSAFCGVFFPITFFPGFLQVIVSFFPMTHGLQIIRLSLAGAPANDTLPVIMALLAMTVFFLSTGMFTLQKSLAWAKKNGKL